MDCNTNEGTFIHNFKRINNVFYIHIEFFSHFQIYFNKSLGVFTQPWQYIFHIAVGFVDTYR